MPRVEEDYSRPLTIYKGGWSLPEVTHCFANTRKPRAQVSHGRRLVERLLVSFESRKLHIWMCGGAGGEQWFKFECSVWPAYPSTCESTTVDD